MLSSYATLADAFNNPGISDDSDIFAANFDGVGNSYSAQTLARCRPRARRDGHP